MSVIGPRPLLVEYLPYYTKEEHHRHDVRPGFCYAVYLKNDTKLVLYYLNSETNFVAEEHDLSERLEVGFIKNKDGNIYYRYDNGEYAIYNMIIVGSISVVYCSYDRWR